MPLDSVNEPAKSVVSAVVDAPAAAAAPRKSSFLAAPAALTAAPAGGSLVLAATAGTSGPTGDYAATPLQASGTWSGGGSSGAFAWSYLVGVPAVPGGLQPTVALGLLAERRRAHRRLQQPGELDRRRLELGAGLHRAPLQALRRRQDRRHQHRQGRRPLLVHRQRGALARRQADRTRLPERQGLAPGRRRR
ncbi:hypothetical protein ACFQ0M_09835 [Kitasatospora aburaviensis]